MLVQPRRTWIHEIFTYRGTVLPTIWRRLLVVGGLSLVLTIGHADKIGSTGYNDALSRRRAEAVGAYLLAAGVSPAVMRVQYRGSSEPVSSRHEDNRRATVAVVE